MITQEQLDAHAAWMRCEPGGIRLDLSDANLIRADLTGVVLTRAALRGSDLTRANLSGAVLTRANLRGSDLTGAVLTGAVLTDADLSGAVGAIDAGTDLRGYRFVGVRHSDGWRIAAGCRWFTMPEAREHWKGNRDALTRLDVIEDNT